MKKTTRVVGLRLDRRPDVGRAALLALVYPAGVRRVRYCPWFGARGLPARLLRDLVATQLAAFGRRKEIREQTALVETCGRECKHLCEQSAAEEAVERAILERVRSSFLSARQREKAALRRNRARFRRKQAAEGSGTSGAPERLRRPSAPPGGGAPC